MPGKGRRAVQVMLGRHEGKIPFEEGYFAAEWPNYKLCPPSLTGFNLVICVINKAAYYRFLY